MRFVVDECCPRSLVVALRDAGHEASYVRDDMGGVSDIDVAAAASAQGRIVVTLDYDFGDLAVRSLAAPVGVIIVQATTLLPHEQPLAVVSLVQDVGDGLLGKLVILSKNKRRLRDL